jgi:2-oxoglutarate dehydrogenase complex dehydrogenase (E1) component-like enzyme
LHSNGPDINGTYTLPNSHILLINKILKFSKFICDNFVVICFEIRFGLDGCEVLIPGMKTLIDRSAELGIESIVIGMAHRGRLNVLGNVVRKPLEHLFYEFEKGAVIPEDWGSGDVKYHLGTSYDRPTRSGKKVLLLSISPTH